jgi:hypothetical protein
MKKILLIFGSELSTLQMFTYLKQKKKTYIIDLLIQKNYNNNFFKIFKPNCRKIFFINEVPSPLYFSIFKFWNILHANKNKIISKKIHDSLVSNNFNINGYSEVFFSNEHIASYILYYYRNKKIYFNHSPIDVLLDIKLSFFSKIKIFIECFINNNFMNIYVKCRGDFLQKSIFENFLIKKNKKKMLSKKIFQKLFYKYNKKNIKKNLNYQYNLINFYIPYFKYTLFFRKYYINFFFKNILVKIFEKKNTQKDIYLIKFRSYISLKFQLNIINEIKKKFPGKKVILVNKTFPTLNTLESVILNFNIKKYFTTFSSSIYLGKILNKKILIYDYSLISRDFWKQNWSHLKTKNNYNNYLPAIKFYKNQSHKL